MVMMPKSTHFLSFGEMGGWKKKQKKKRNPERGYEDKAIQERGVKRE